MYSKRPAFKAHVYRERTEFERIMNGTLSTVGIHSANLAVLETMMIKCLDHMANGSDVTEQRFAKRVSEQMSKMSPLRGFIDRIYDCPNSLHAFLSHLIRTYPGDETPLYERRVDCWDHRGQFNDYGETFQSLLWVNGDSPKRVEFLKHLFVEYVRRFDNIIARFNDYENDPETGDDEWQARFIGYRNFYWNLNKLNENSQTVKFSKIKLSDAPAVDKSGSKGSWADVLQNSSKASDEKTESSSESSSEDSSSCEVNKLSRSTLLEHSGSQPIETLPKYTKVKRLEFGEDGKFNEISEIMDSTKWTELMMEKSTGVDELGIFKVGSFCSESNQISTDQVLALPSVIETLRKVTVLPDGSDILFKPSDYELMKTRAENVSLMFQGKKLIFATMRHGKSVDETSECLMAI